ncbi:MAG: hypothetical protein ACKOAS_05110 [Verrucomicrobiota bacterium]
MSDPESILEAAEKVCGILERHRVGAVVIGAVALAAYNYVRNTEDLDFGVNAELEELRCLAHSLVEEGFSVELHEPDAQDPLGGVLDVGGPFGLLQIVSFAGRFTAVIEDALQSSNLLVREGSPLKLVPIAHLIALKLYAGGHKSQADIVELLRRNPDLDLESVRELCRRYRLRGLEDLIEEAHSL